MVFWKVSGERKEERLRERLRVGASAGMGERSSGMRGVRSEERE